jgi:hypothetical protein
MTSPNKSLIAAFFIRVFGLTGIVKRLYSIAIKLEFKDTSASVLIEIGKLLKVYPSQSLKMVRLGSQTDGGYVVFDDFDSNDIALSFGIGDNNSFDQSIGSLVSVVHMYDHTVPGPPIEFENGNFHRFGISHIDRVQFLTVPAILADIPKEKELILKIDIEGAEWEIFRSLDRNQLSRFKQIVGEFHNIHNLVRNEKGQELVLSVLKCLTNSHTFVNLHPNNWGRADIIQGFLVPDVLEFTLVRNDRFSYFQDQRNNRANLNRPNNPLAPEIYLNFLSES